MILILLKRMKKRQSNRTAKERFKKNGNLRTSCNTLNGTDKYKYRKIVEDEELCLEEESPIPKDHCTSLLYIF